MGTASAVNWGDVKASDVCFIPRVDLRLLQKGSVEEVVSIPDPNALSFERLGFKRLRNL